MHDLANEKLLTVSSDIKFCIPLPCSNCSCQWHLQEVDVEDLAAEAVAVSAAAVVAVVVPVVVLAVVSAVVVAVVVLLLEVAAAVLVVAVAELLPEVVAAVLAALRLLLSLTDMLVSSSAVVRRICFLRKILLPARMFIKRSL